MSVMEHTSKARQSCCCNIRIIKVIGMACKVFPIVQKIRTDGWTDRWMDGQTDGWMDGPMDGQMDGQMVEQTDMLKPDKWTVGRTGMC